MPDEVWGRDYPPLGRTSDVHKLESAQLNQQENHSQVLYALVFRVRSQSTLHGKYFPLSFLLLCIKLPYNGKLSREKTFVNFAVLWLFAKVFLHKIWWLGILWRGKSEQSVKIFSAKIVFFTNLWKFSPLKVFCYAYMLNANCSTKKLTGIEQSY